MSEETVGVVRKHIAAFQERDVASAVSFLDPHIVVDWSRAGAMESPVIVGLDALQAFVRRYRGTFDTYRYEIERLTDLGAGTVLAVITETGRGRTSGVPVNRSFASLYTVIAGKIARITQFPTQEEALEAAGLRG